MGLYENLDRKKLLRIRWTHWILFGTQKSLYGFWGAGWDYPKIGRKLFRFDGSWRVDDWIERGSAVIIGVAGTEKEAVLSKNIKLYWEAKRWTIKKRKHNKYYLIIFVLSLNLN